MSETPITAVPVDPAVVAVDAPVVAADPGPRHEAVAPVISAGARSVVYIVCLILNVLATVVLGIAPIVGLMSMTEALSIGGIVFVAINLIASGLGVAYRPTRPGTAN